MNTVSTEPSLLVKLIEAYADRPNPRSVAVVGNQPLEPDEQRAKAIDSCDVVFRVNGYVCDEPGAAPTVGRRTHVVVFNRRGRGSGS